MTVSAENADNYFAFHNLKDNWNSLTPDLKQSVLDKAVNLITNAFTLRDGYVDLSSYDYAVYEQAIHMLSYDKERYLTQTQGVGLFSYDGIQVQQKPNLISPITTMLLKKLIYRKVGNIR